MDLLDRYLAAVAALLPKDQREDIVAELRDILLNQLEEKEAELGRPLKTAETEAVLKAFGHPIAVAGRFGAPRSLIGPELYPFYMFAVKALLALAAVVSLIPVVIGVITGGMDPAGGFSRFLSDFISIGLSLIGAATVVGAGIERGWIRLGKAVDWKVSELPRLDGVGLSGMGLGGLGSNWGGGERGSRFEAAFELAATVLFILWWTGAVAAPWSNRVGHGDMFLLPAAVWTALYLPILALAGVQVLSSLVGLARPAWVRARAALEIVGALAGLAVAGVLWSAGRLVVVATHAPAASRAGEVAALQGALDQSFHLTAGVMAVVLLVKAGVSIWRLARGAGRPVSTPVSGAV